MTHTSYKPDHQQLRENFHTQVKSFAIMMPRRQSCVADNLLGLNVSLDTISSMFHFLPSLNIILFNMLFSSLSSMLVSWIIISYWCLVWKSSCFLCSSGFIYETPQSRNILFIPHGFLFYLFSHPIPSSTLYHRNQLFGVGPETHPSYSTSHHSFYL